MAKEPRERELKYRLQSLESYRRLVEAQDLGVPAPCLRQDNYYFDSVDLRLLRAGAMLRLRRDDVLVLTFKHGRESDEIAGYFDSVEIEEPVPLETLDKALARPASLFESGFEPARRVLERFGRLPLRLIGRLRNERRRIDALYRLEVDRLTYPDGGESYEVEIETDEPLEAQRWLEKEFAARGIAALPERRTKLESLLERPGAS